MAKADHGPLLDEHLDELEIIVKASENGGVFENKPGNGNAVDVIEDLSYVLGWHDRHDRKLLEAARWALANGWKR